MPELPEVEIVKQSLAKKIEQKKIQKVIIKNRNLRFKIPQKFEELLKNKIIKKINLITKNINIKLLNKEFSKSNLKNLDIDKCLFCSVVPNSFKKIKNFFEITFWKPLDEMVRLLGSSVTPCALFALGATLVSFRNNIRWQEVPLFVIMKTIIHPLVVWVIASLVFSIKEAIWIQVLVILAAQPTGVNPFLFASRYNVGQVVSSSAVFMSTVISIFTLSLLLTFFR